jgi:hypothetical protein
MAQPLENPGLAVRVITTGVRIGAAKEGSSDAMSDAVEQTRQIPHRSDRARPHPSGHTSRRWGVAIKGPDDSAVVEADPWAE